MTYTSRNYQGYTPKTVIKPAMVLNKYYTNHICKEHDTFKEHEWHLKRLNKINTDKFRNTFNSSRASIRSSKSNNSSTSKLRTINSLDQRTENMRLKIIKERE